MARKKTNNITNYFSDFKWRESYTSLILGAIIVVILGLLVANFLTKKSPDITDTGEQTSITQDANKPPTSGVYKVQADESLSQLAKKFYGSEEFWPQLAAMNNIANPDVIWADAEIKVPAKDQLVKNAVDTSYEVKDGDTLFDIAQKTYGDGSRWMEIARSNNVSYLPNGNPLIFAGSTITIPR